jgi:hypothetical protein
MHQLHGPEALEFARHGRCCKDDMGKKTFTTDQAKLIGEAVGVDWGTSPFDVEQFRMGLDVELEHGASNRQTNVTSSDPIMTGKIALAHLQEFPDYYTRLARMEAEAEGKPLR